jgi:glucose-1-phosphate adenylyltransferase
VPNPPEIPGKPGFCLASMGVYVFETATLVLESARDAKRNTAHDFGKNIIPGLIKTGRVFAYNFAESRWGNYWRDIGLLDAYYDANMDLVNVRPEFNLYDPDWRIHTAQPQLPPAKFVHEEGDRTGLAINSIVSAGSILSGAQVRRSVLSPGVRIHSFSKVEDSILFDGVDIGENCHIRRAIIDKGVRIPAGTRIGLDPDSDRARFTVTAGGTIVLPKEMQFSD